MGELGRGVPQTNGTSEIFKLSTQFYEYAIDNGKHGTHIDGNQNMDQGQGSKDDDDNPSKM